MTIEFTRRSLPISWFFIITALDLALNPDHAQDYG